MICTIPKSKIKRIAVYVNTGKKTTAQIKRELGCQFILNGGLYDRAKFQPINHLTVDGKVLSANGNPFGYGVKDGGLVFSYGNNIKADTFLGAYPVLVRDGKATGDPAPEGLGGYQHRSCVGVTKSGDVVLLCDQTNRSLDGMAGELVQAGCDTAINLDGGGSSQCDFDGDAMTSGRVVHNFLCIWTKEDPKVSTTKKKLLLIAGHGAGDPGAVSKLGTLSYQEAQEARTLVPMIAEALSLSADVTVYDTGRNAYSDYKAGTLAAKAQVAKYDYVLEVHFNAFQLDQGNGKQKGTEIYISTARNDSKVETAILQHMEALGWPNRGVKKKDYSVIATAWKAGVPAALLETCFLDDADDMAIYTKSRQSVAQAIAVGLLEGLGVPAVVAASPAPPPETPADDTDVARAWVMAQGISDGSSPERAATREEVWRMLYRMAK